MRSLPCAASPTSILTCINDASACPRSRRFAEPAIGARGHPPGGERVIDLLDVAGVLRLPCAPDLSAARDGAPSKLAAAWHANLRATWPRTEFAPSARFVALNGYLFHVGLALVFFGYAPHIAFVRRLTGLSWPALPDCVMYLAGAATIVSLLVALGMRFGDAVRKRISTADDLVAWVVTFLPLLTGMAVTMEPSSTVLAREVVLYRTPLAAHLLSVELLLLWFPFGKLMHAVLFAFSRSATGVRYGHRGVRP